MTDRADPGTTPRTRIRRLPERSVHERAAAHAVLDAALVGHVAVVQDGQPYVLPVAFARRDDAVVFHGSTGSRLMRALADGQPTCFTATLVDGLVLARSAFESSMNYRSIMVLGIAHRLTGDEELDALRTISEHLLPGRWAEIRHPSAKERAATLTLELPLDECSVKIRTGGPADLPEDLADPALRGVWAGDVPIVESFSTPVPSPDLAPEVPVPEYVARWRR